jgi:hypothetical protein
MVGVCLDWVKPNPPLEADVRSDLTATSIPDRHHESRYAHDDKEFEFQCVTADGVPLGVNPSERLVHRNRCRLLTSHACLPPEQKAGSTCDVKSLAVAASQRRRGTPRPLALLIALASVERADYLQQRSRPLGHSAIV